MAGNTGFTLENLGGDQLVSDLFKTLEEVLRNETNDIQLTKEIAPNEKGALFVGILIGIASGVASNAVYDTLKTVLKMYKTREDYNPGVKIKLNGEEKTLGELEKGNLDRK